jgi:hypothetical protein
MGRNVYVSGAVENVGIIEQGLKMHAAHNLQIFQNRSLALHLKISFHLKLTFSSEGQSNYSGQIPVTLMPPLVLK